MGIIRNATNKALVNFAFLLFVLITSLALAKEAASISDTGEIEVVAPFGVANLFGNTITINRKRERPDVFYKNGVTV